MKYQNTLTGVVIDVPCEIKGENWEPVKKAPSEAPKKAETEKSAPKRKATK